MTTCSEIITLALRQVRVLGSGRDARAAEGADGLVALQGMFDAWVANGMFGRLTDVYTAVAYTAHENERIRAASSAVVTIPTTFSEGGLDGSDRGPRDLSLIEVYNIVAATRQVSLFDRNAWVRIEALALADTCPLANRGASGLAACLAETWADMFGAEVGSGVRRLAASFRTGLSLKLGSTRDSVGADYF